MPLESDFKTANDGLSHDEPTPWLLVVKAVLQCWIVERIRHCSHGLEARVKCELTRWKKQYAK